MSDTLAESAQRANARQHRDDALIAVIARHGITLPKNAIEWRTASAKGELRGLNLCVQLLCTDGVVAWALTGDERVFFCHLSNFVEDKPEKQAPRSGADKAKGHCAKPFNKTVADALEALLS